MLSKTENRGEFDDLRSVFMFEEHILTLKALFESTK